MLPPFTSEGVRPHPFGLLASVRLPGTPEVPPEALARLDPREQTLVDTWRGLRRAEWVGGRLAFAEALASAGLPPGPVGTGPRGEPILPAGVAGSIAHKRERAVALVGPLAAGTLGIDLEDLAGPARLAIASHVLRPSEQARLVALPEAQRWPALLGAFAVKEALYKAMHPHLGRYVEFREAEVELSPGEARPVPVTLHLEQGGPLQAEARLDVDGRWLIAAARVLPRASA